MGVIRRAEIKGECMPRDSTSEKYLTARTYLLVRAFHFIPLLVTLVYTLHPDASIYKK